MSVEIIYSYEGIEEQLESIRRLADRTAEKTISGECKSGCVYEEMLDVLQDIIGSIGSSFEALLFASRSFLEESMKMVDEADRY